MNSISLVTLSSNCYLILYADDILLFKPIDESDLNDFHRDLQAILEWIIHHSVHLNHTKTQFLPVSRSRNQPAPSITLNGYIIPSSTSVKYLVVTIFHNLTWSHHVNDICRTTKRQLGRVHRQFRHAPCHLQDKIYHTTIFPRLEYCCAVWDPHHSKHKQAIENVQKFGGRVISQRSMSITQSETFIHKMSHSKLKLCYKIVNNLSCIPASIFTAHPHPSPQLHHSKPLHMPFVSTIAHKSSCFIDIISHWNSLLNEIISCTSASLLKETCLVFFSKLWLWSAIISG